MSEVTARRNRPYAPRMLPDDRREQLLDAVLAVIDTDSVAAVNIDSVARQAGVTRPVVYGLFDDAQHLLRSALEREERRVLAQLAPYLPASGETDVERACVRLLDGLLQAVENAPTRWRMVYMSDGSPIFHRHVERGRAAVTALVTEVVRSHTQPARYPDVDLLAHSLFAVVWEAGRLFSADSQRFPRKRVSAFTDDAIRRIADQQRG